MRCSGGPPLIRLRQHRERNEASRERGWQPRCSSSSLLMAAAARASDDAMPAPSLRRGVSASPPRTGKRRRQQSVVAALCKHVLTARATGLRSNWRSCCSAASCLLHERGSRRRAASARTHGSGMHTLGQGILGGIPPPFRACHFTVISDEVFTVVRGGQCGIVFPSVIAPISASLSFVATRLT